MSRKNISAPGITVPDDGLYTPEIGDWSDKKYRLLWHYANLFATSMKNKWDQRVFIDLFSGSGYARVRGTSRIVQTSSLLAIQVADLFDCYVFCDSDKDCIDALKQRVARLNPKPKCYFENCDVNAACADIIANLPLHGKTKKVLSFCLIDPFKLSDIRFNTIRNLATHFVDFMINIPAMDPIRNEGIYYADSSMIVSDYLGIDSWRNDRKVGDPSISFDFYIAQKLDSQMKALGYSYGGLSETVRIRSTEKNLSLYRLGFYSRNHLGERFWKEAKKYSDPQLSLF
jgi:three-Cys-motif partner protein